MVKEVSFEELKKGTGGDFVYTEDMGNSDTSDLVIVIIGILQEYQKLMSKPVTKENPVMLHNTNFWLVPTQNEYGSPFFRLGFDRVITEWNLEKLYNAAASAQVYLDKVKYEKQRVTFE